MHRMSYTDAAQMQAAQSRNVLQSIILVGGIGIITALSAYLLSGRSGVILSVVTIGLLLVISPRIAPEAIVRLFRGRLVDARQGGELSLILERLAQRAGLPAVPKLAVIPSPTLNAFATGTRSNALIAVTEGLLQKLNLREVAGVLAHETAHIRNNDTLVMSLADMMSRLTQFMSYFAVFLFIFNIPMALAGQAQIPWLGILVLYFAPTMSSLLQLALSRTREYDADLGGASLLGDPGALASALNKLERYQGRFWEELVMPGRRIPQPSVLRTHPPTEERVRRLLALQTPQPLPPLPIPQPYAHVAGFAPLPLRPRYHWSGFWY
jgi:heat shock protein HtpX